MRIRHPSPFTARWRAHWIWFEAPAIGIESATRPVRAVTGDRVGLFRRQVALSERPATARCRIWSDGRHVLRVNGEEVARGPVRSNPRRSHYDVVDLAPHLRSGDNVITVTARHFAGATSWWAPVPPSYPLGAGSLVLEALIGDEWLVSDASWRCRPGEAWSPVAAPGDVAALPLESFDAAAHPAAWESAFFDDGGWGPATVLAAMHVGASGDPHPPSEPFGLLLPPVRPTAGGGVGVRHEAALVARTTGPGAGPEEDPVRQVLADEQPQPSDGAVVEHHAFDLGHVAAGTLELLVTGAAAGTVVDVAAAEHLDGEGHLAPLGQHAGLRYRCAGSDVEQFESLDVIGTRYLHVSVRSPDGGPGPDVGLALGERLRPRPEGVSFACSDPELERIFAVGLRTVDLCAHDAYVDCPTREQRAWTGDSVVHQMVDLVTNPDWSLARWHPQLAATTRADGMLPMAVAGDFDADDRTILPDWSLHWVRSVHNLWRYTGDRDLIGDLLPVAERALRWFEPYLGDDGLLDGVTGWILLDWASVYSEGCSSTLNALWARGLEDLAEMADALGNGGTAGWARDRREGVRSGFDRFWDEGRGVYVDHVVDGEARRAAAQHPGATALAAGLVPDDRIARVVTGLTDRSRLLRHSWVMDTVTVDGGSTGHLYLATGYPEPDWDVETRMVACEPFFRYVLHDGLARAGRADLIADQCRDWIVFLDAGETSWPECWNGGTRCHGWSSTPSRDLIVHTLGITPGEPGYGSVRIAPALGGLAWAKATVPTPHGPVTAEAHADGRIEVDSPVPVIGA